MSIRQDIGIVTAYGYAVSKGYQGTEEEFAEAMANVGTNIDEIRDAIDTFVNQTVPAATQAVTDEGLDQVAAVNQAGADQVDAVEDKGTIEIGAVEAAGTAQIGLVEGAGTTQVGLVNTAGTTQVGNVNTAGGAQVAAVQQKGDEVIQSIPADYSELTQEVSDLDQAFIELESTEIKILSDKAWTDSTGTVPSKVGYPGMKASNGFIVYDANAIFDSDIGGTTHRFIYCDANKQVLGVAGAYSQMPATTKFFVFYTNSMTYAKYTRYASKIPTDELNNAFNSLVSTVIPLIADSYWTDNTIPKPGGYAGCTRCQDFISYDPGAVFDSDIGGTIHRFLYCDANKNYLGLAGTYSQIPNTAKYFVFYSDSITYANYTRYAPKKSTDELTNAYNEFVSEINKAINVIGVKNYYKNSLRDDYESNGITFAKGNDGTLTVNGTATGDIYFDPEIVHLKAGTYIFSGFPDNAQEIITGSAYLYILDANLQILVTITRSSGERAFVVSSDQDIHVRFAIGTGATLTNAVFKLMIRNYGDSVFTQYAMSNPELKEYIDNKNAAKGKEVVWFGTSIPEGTYTDDKGLKWSYPGIIGRKLDLIMHNESVGSSSVHCRSESRISETNPYGFNEDFKGVVVCLTGTLIETPPAEAATKCYDKEWLVNWWKAYVNGGTYVPGYENDCPYDGTIFNTSYDPDFMAALTEDKIRNYSYQRKLDKYLTAETLPDMFVFDHGRNDILNSATAAVDFDPSEPYSPYNFRGAMNFLINRIYEYNFKTKIVLSGHYSNQIRNPLDIVQDRPDQIALAQEHVSEYWELPLFKLWNYTGWCNKTIDVNGTDKSVLCAWMPDGVHPHSDTSGKAIEHLASLILPFIRDNLQ